jgi:prepilin-type N-terminal cleavage/methylation domain-containing protein
MSFSSSRRGFTIVELLIVIVVIAILAAISLVAYTGVQNKARVSAVSSALSQASKKLATYAVDGTGYPADLATIGINDTGGVSYEYSVNNATNPATYCITATAGTTSYKVSSTSTQPASGGCAGHGVGGSAAITNLATNPSIESNTAGFAGAASTITQSSLWAANGTRSLTITPSSTTSSDSYANLGGDTGAMRLGMQAGKTYGLRAVINVPATLTGALNTGRVLCLTAWQKTASYSFQSSCAPNNPGTYPLSLTFTIDPAATEAFIRLYNGSMSGGGVVSYDAIMLTEGSSVPNYADGNSSDWTWNGTVNNSTSRGPAL